MKILWNCDDKPVYYFDPNSSEEQIKFQRALSDMLSAYLYESRDIVVCCIGTNKFVFDLLGPAVGDRLAKRANSAFDIYGTTKSPVHARNLDDFKYIVRELYDDPFVIAVDAGFCMKDRVGSIALAEAPVKPGAGIGKDIPGIGDISITGFVKSTEDTSYYELLKTNKKMIMRMADFIADGLIETFKNTNTNSVDDKAWFNVAAIL